MKRKKVIDRKEKKIRKEKEIMEGRISMNKWLGRGETPPTKPDKEEGRGNIVKEMRKKFERKETETIFKTERKSKVKEMVNKIEKNTNIQKKNNGRIVQESKWNEKIEKEDKRKVVVKESFLDRNKLVVKQKLQNGEDQGKSSEQFKEEGKNMDCSGKKEVAGAWDGKARKWFGGPQDEVDGRPTWAYEGLGCNNSLIGKERLGSLPAPSGTRKET